MPGDYHPRTRIALKTFRATFSRIVEAVAQLYCGRLDRWPFKRLLSGRSGERRDERLWAANRRRVMHRNLSCSWAVRNGRFVPKLWFCEEAVF